MVGDPCMINVDKTMSSTRAGTACAGTACAGKVGNTDLQMAPGLNVERAQDRWFRLSSGCTPLHIACQEGSTETAPALLPVGAGASDLARHAQQAARPERPARSGLKRRPYAECARTVRLRGVERSGRIRRATLARPRLRRPAASATHAGSSREARAMRHWQADAPS